MVTHEPQFCRPLARRGRRAVGAVAGSLLLCALAAGCGQRAETARPVVVGQATKPAESAPAPPADSPRPTAEKPPAPPAGAPRPAVKFELLKTLQLEVALLKAVAFSRDGSLATGDTPVKVWKLGADKPVQVLDAIGPAEAAALAFSPDGSLLAVGCRDGAVVLWDCGVKQVKHRLTVSDKGVLSVAFSAKGDRVAAGDYDGRINLWDVATGQSVHTIKVEDRGVRAAISPDGQSLISAGATVTLWDAATGQAKGEFKAEEPRAVRVMGAAFSPDGKLVATAEATPELVNAVLLWSVADRKVRGTLRHELGVTSIAFSPDGQLLASTGLDSHVRVWGVADQKLLQELETGANSADAVAWSADGRLLAAVCGDDAVRVWSAGGSAPKPPDAPASPKADPSPSPAGGIAASPPRPATLEDVLAFDVSKLPMPRGTERERGDAAHWQYTAPGRLAEVADFLRKALPPLGWAEEKQPTDGLDPNMYVSLGFDKAGFHVTMLLTKGNKEGTVEVNMSNWGNADARRFPKPADAQAGASFNNHVSYTTASQPPQAAEFCRKELTALGWQERTDSSAKFHAKEGRTILRFANNAMEFGVVIVVNKEGRTEVSYMPRLRDPAKLLAEVPARNVPKPATEQEALQAIDLRQFPRPEGAKVSNVQSANLNYDAPGTVDAAASFCRAKLAEQGWKEQTAHAMELDDRKARYFEKGGFLLYLWVAKGTKDGQASVSMTNMGNVDTRRIPRPKGADLGIAQHANTHYTTAVPMEGVAEFYRTELRKLGWTESERSGPGKPNLPGVLAFIQNGMKLNIEIGTSGPGQTDVKLNPWVLGLP